MPVKRQPKNIIFIIGLSVIFILLLIFAIAAIIQINQTKSDIILEEHALQENQDKLIKLTQLSKREYEFEASLKRMIKLIPNQADESGVIRMIQNLSQELRVEFVKIDFGEMVVNNNVNVIPITLSFSGDYGNLVSLIGRIVSAERLIRIDTIKIARNQETEQMNVNITGRTFFR